MIAIPAGLAQHAQFILWRLEPGVPKAIKVPINARRPAYPSNAMDPSIWLTATEAVAFAQQLGPGYGVGFVFTEAIGMWFLDIDNALGADGQWSPVAQQLAQVFEGCAIEVSQSQKGLHIFGSGPVPEHGCKNKTFKLELYHTDRFVALTGLQTRGTALHRHDAGVQWLVANYFTKGAAGVELDDVTREPVPEWLGPVDDDDLIRRAMQSHSTRAMFSDKVASFADLWTCNVHTLAKAYPSDQGDAFDRSAADQALLQHLAFWTGKDGERMLRLMRRSGLVRPKWDEHKSYLRLSCISALQMQVDVLHDKQPEPVAGVAPPTAAPMAPAMREVTGATFLTPTQQMELFHGCVYVIDRHEVLVPGGDLLDAARFKVKYGGYTFAMDNENQRTVRNAFEAFTESQALRPPKADSTIFRPDLAGGVVVTTGGRSFANVWWPIETERCEGNAEPFLRHLRLLLPNERDAAVLLYYMAACVQHKGVKFQWAPLLQGVEGNGKTFFSHCVINALSERYCHIPRPMDISSRFNPWLRNKLFIAVEDVYVEHERTEIFEILKPMITGRLQPVEAKGVDTIMGSICANFLFNSNHKDGLRKTGNDRRIAPLFTHQQRKEHLSRDGLSRDYFSSLYNWYNHGGMPVVNHLLYTMQIPEEFNPALGGIAPDTSSTAEAVQAGLGTVEQHILEAIEAQSIGFMGGWVSSVFLEKLLEVKGLAKRVPLNKRRELMRSLGYDYHPALVDGRTNNSVLPDAGKPRLYIRDGHMHASVGSAAEVARLYSAAQMPAIGVSQ